MLRRLPAAKASDGGKKEEMEGGPWVPDEEVFIVQLHLRASLLNDSFQRQVTDRSQDPCARAFRGFVFASSCVMVGLRAE
eukprot:3394509-Rhodomonas_salina.2